ncbi:helix-turn-helix transcriptional regulator [Variovorax humicola]|uniref:Helix-turn-helix transcriptional regulator n=1 Tax=Variovorax humicola TaxID=1769758 RepID=A0ABU8W768_9BURK
MNDAPEIPRIAALLADPARASMVWTLIDGTTRPAGELAFAANVSAQSASAHLAKLVEGGLLVAESQGRHRYFRIAGADAAHLIESLASFSAKAARRVPPQPALVRAMPSHFLHARTCYDHLAGEVAVEILEAMRQARWLVEDGPQYKLTRLGKGQLAALGVDAGSEGRGRRAFARSCVDLTQRRPHLAGALGAALLDLYTREGWIVRAPRSRVVSVSPKGAAAFSRVFGLAV